MDKLEAVHPGEVLQKDFLEPLGITAYRLSKDIGVPQTRTSAILHGKRSITADMALRLAKYFDNSPKFWLNLQDNYRLQKLERSGIVRVDEIKPYGQL